jgi:hypothetical protein
MPTSSFDIRKAVLQLGSIAIMCGLGACVAPGAREVEAGADEGGVSATPEAIIGGVDDTLSNPTTNAVVNILSEELGPCTGTLVAPDIVLTAGHCTDSWFPWPQYGGLPPGYQCQGCSPANGTTCTPCNAGNAYCTTPTGVHSPLNCVTGDRTQYNGLWHRFTDWDPNWTPIIVYVQPDEALPALASYNASWFSVPQFVGPQPFVGSADIIMIGITGAGGVNPSYAAPRGVYTSPPPGLTSSSPLTLVGFSQASHTARQRISASAYSLVDPPIPSQFYFNLAPTASTEGGDSGGPVLFGSGTGDVMGVLQGGYNPGHATGTFYTGGIGGSQTIPNLAGWLTQGYAGYHRSLCSATQSPVAAAPNDGMVKLMSWYSAGRQDNFMTTNSIWNGCYPGFDRVQSTDFVYDYTHLDGWIPRGDLTQPPDTEALNLWYSSTWNDNAALIAAQTPGGGYGFVQRIGWIYRHPASGLVPVYSWYNGAIHDYFTTTFPNDYSGAGYTRYGANGIIGYVRSSGAFAQRYP